MNTQTRCGILLVLCGLGLWFHALDGGHMLNNIKRSLPRGGKIRPPLPITRPVEYEFWTSSSSNYHVKFVNDFKGAAQVLEQRGYARFTPHYTTWNCPEPFTVSRECRSRCINRGRYCNWEFIDNNNGYEGKDVVVQNLRQACFFKVANETGRPWLWWNYAADFARRCPMNDNKLNKNCADRVIRSLSLNEGLDIGKIDECIGDVDADTDHPILKSEQEAQIGQGPGGPITILPTLVVNSRQYRGKLQRRAVLKAICGGLEDTVHRNVCLTGDGSGALDLKKDHDHDTDTYHVFKLL